MTQTQDPMDRIPQLNLQALHEPLKEEMLSAMRAVLERCSFIKGPATEAFERNFAEQTLPGSHVIGVANGTDAITLAALALQLPKDSEAIIPAMTYIATVEALIHAGIKVRLVDVEDATWGLDPIKLRDVISPSTSLIVPVHLYGQMAKMDAIRDEADRYSCKILEDASQAQGAKWLNRPVGFWGHIATYSFYPGKNLGAVGDAGAILSRDPKLIETCAMLGNHGGIKKYEHFKVGYNSRLDELQAAVLDIKLKHLESWNEKRRNIAKMYGEILSGIEGLQLPETHGEAVHVYHQYVVLVEEREPFTRFLSDRGIGTGVHYPKAIHQLPAFQNYDFGGASFPVAEKLAARGVSLPMCPTLTPEQVQRVGNTIREYFGK